MAEAALPVPDPPEPPDDPVYTWYDKHGRPRLAANIEDIPEEARGQVVVSELGGGAKAALATELTLGDFTGDVPEWSKVDLTRLASDLELDGEALLKHEKVFVYSTSWCGFCKKAMAYLREREIPFEEKDIERSARTAAELKAKNKAAGITSGGVPIIDVHGNMIVGFDKSRLDELLEKAGYGAAESVEKE